MRRPALWPTTPAWLLLGLLTGGCAGDPAVEATTVLNFPQCQGLEPGLTPVDYATVARIRGSTLLQPASPDGQTPQTDSGKVPRADDGDAPLLVAIYRGRQPTPGYRFTLEGAHRRNDTAVVRVRWETPEPGSVQAQMLTHPCLVVALPRAGFRRLEVVDQSGDSVGSLDIPQADAPTRPP